MMIILEPNELENSTCEEIYEKKKSIEKFINDYENNNIPREDYLVKPSPQTKYKMCKDCLIEIEEFIHSKKLETEIEIIKEREEKLCQIIEKITGCSEDNVNELIFEIVTKIIKLPFETPTTIAELIKHKSKVAFVEPLVQRDIYNYVCAVCNEYNIKLNIIDGFLRGMPYHYVIKKIEPQGDSDIENKFVSKETNMSVIDLFKNDNINIEEKSYDTGLDTSINNSRVGMSNDKINLENPMDFFINNFIDKNEEVEFRDNKKDIIYSMIHSQKVFFQKFNQFISFI